MFVSNRELGQRAAGPGIALRRRPSTLDIMKARDLCHRVMAHRGDGGGVRKDRRYRGSRGARSWRSGLRLGINLDWKRMRDVEHSLVKSLAAIGPAAPIQNRYDDDRKNRSGF